jgi:phosphoglycolate phosphatase
MEPAAWPRAVIFDLDGTLADSFAAIQVALNRALRDNGLAEHDLEWTRSHVGHGAVELVRSAVGPADAATMRAVGASFGDHYRAIYLDQTPPVPGAGAVLEHVARGSDGRVAVVSNKYAALCRAWLEHWDLARFVARVAGPETSGARKPDRAALLPVLEALGVAPDEALLVGDMDIDVEAGRNAGVPVVAVCGGASPADVLERAGAMAVLGALAELPAWLAEHGRGWGKAADN